MEISSKGRHAVRIMTDIARQEGNIVSIATIAARQGITAKYLEKIVSLLVKNNLLTSSRGKNGGYLLTKKADEYSIKEILDATGDTTKIAKCNHDNCPRINKCDSMGVWFALTELINNYLESVSLQDLIDKTYKK